MSTPDIEQARLIGEIHGMVKAMRDAQLQQGDDIKQMDARLRHQETTAARHGAIYGGLMGVGVALIVEGGKQWLRDKFGGAA